MEEDGVYLLSTGGGAPEERWCNQSIRGGGWTLLSVIRPDSTQVVGDAVCRTASAAATCAGRLPEARVSSATELLIVDAATGAWVVLSGFSTSGALARLAGQAVPTGAECAAGCDAVLDPALHVSATSGMPMVHARPMRQWWRFGGWWLGAGEDAGDPCGALVGLGYAGAHGIWSRADAAACGARVGESALQLYWR